MWSILALLGLGALAFGASSNRYINGSDTRRQKRLYNESRDRHNNYASEVQATIDNISCEIQQSMQGLRALEEQQYHYSNRSYEMENQLNQYAIQYDSG
ncbi:MAG: hypothetical protein ACE1S7_07025 [Candidatus Tisiphia sp.]